MQKTFNQMTDYELLDLATNIHLNTDEKIKKNMATDKLMKRYSYLVYDIVNSSFLDDKNISKATLIQIGFGALLDGIHYYDFSTHSNIYHHLTEKITAAIKSNLDSAPKKSKILESPLQKNLQYIYDIVNFVYIEGGPSKNELLNLVLSDLNYTLDFTEFDITELKHIVNMINDYIKASN